MTLDGLVQMILREMTVMKVRDGQDMELLIRSDVEDYKAADFTIHRNPESGELLAVIEMGDAQS